MTKKQKEELRVIRFILRGMSNTLNEQSSKYTLTDRDKDNWMKLEDVETRLGWLLGEEGEW